MLCACGEGRGTDALKRKKEWASFAPHATRVALGQLFAVSYLERMCTAVVKNMKPILAEHGVPLSDMRLLLEEGGRDGKDHWDTYCSLCLGWLPPGTRKICKRCKARVYCSRQCQQIDWGAHKKECGEASDHDLSDS